MEWTVSEDNQWRQLGSVVNAVLLDTKTKAMRRGAISAPAQQSFSQKIQSAGLSSKKLTGNGFLSSEPVPPQGPVQLELPFGIAAAPAARFGVSRTPRGARLM
jgi:hypothetical protein